MADNLCPTQTINTRFTLLIEIIHNSRVIDPDISLPDPENADNAS